MTPGNWGDRLARIETRLDLRPRPPRTLGLPEPELPHDALVLPMYDISIGMLSERVICCCR